MCGAYVCTCLGLNWLSLKRTVLALYIYTETLQSIYLASISWQIAVEDIPWHMLKGILPPLFLLKPPNSSQHPHLSDFSYAIHRPQQHSLWSQITTEHKSYQLHKSMKNRSFHVHVAQATPLSQHPPQKAADSVWLWNKNKKSCRKNNTVRNTMCSFTRLLFSPALVSNLDAI